jgi:ubiquinone/menaquinone biosynthesis C-methylase UbiE
MGLSEKIKLGWDLSASGYAQLIKKELEEGMPKAWVELILENAPAKGKNKILDVGTGPGFFPIILTEAGQDVTGTDFNEVMIEEASKIAENLGLAIDFRVMNTMKLDFPDNTFDMVISRNAVWTILDAPASFAEWLRVLKPGGILLYFDAEYLKKERDPEFKAKCDKDRELYEKEHGKIEKSYDPKDEEKINGWNKEMPLVLVDRPEWDLKTLAEKGFADLKAEIVMTRVTPEKKWPLCRSCPLFMVKGTKPA